MLQTRCVLRSYGCFKAITRVSHRRGLLTLAIETSADDTAVAIVETQSDDNTKPTAHIHHHEKITANNAVYGGIHPRNSAISHQSELPGLIRKALRHLPRASNDEVNTISVPGVDGPVRKPTFISATRGPGMRGGLSVGLDMAKGLCLAYNVPFMGVHHMQAHALTPRLVSALIAKPGEMIEPEFPFRSLLVSGGHTLLVNGKSLTEFEKEVETLDTAAGDCVDKMAKHILPATILEAHTKDTNYGAALEAFAFPNGAVDYDYLPPKTREALLMPQPSRYRWRVPPPLQGSAGREFGFSGLDSAVRKIVLQGSARISETQDKPRVSPMDLDERLELARHAQRVMFEHIADRIHLVLKPPSPFTISEQKKKKRLLEAGVPTEEPVYRLVVSGGVASNKFFRHILHTFMESRGIKVELVFPPIELCTDNAIMIAWAGLEMWEAGWRSKLDCTAENRWPLAGENGLIGIGGWERQS